MSPVPFSSYFKISSWPPLQGLISTPAATIRHYFLHSCLVYITLNTMQTVAAANGLRGGLIALPISRKSPSRRPRSTLIAGKEHTMMRRNFIMFLARLLCVFIAIAALVVIHLVDGTS